MYLIPKKGLRVVDPASMKPLPENGAKVSGNESYWYRQIAVGDCREPSQSESQSLKDDAKKSDEAVKKSKADRKAKPETEEKKGGAK